MLPLKTPEKNPSLPLLASHGWRQSLVFLLLAASLQPLPPSSQSRLSYVSVYSSYEDTNHVGFRNHANPVGPPRTIYIGKDSISKSGHILRFCVGMNSGGKGGQLSSPLQSLYLGLFYSCLGQGVKIMSLCLTLYIEHVRFLKSI